MFKKMFSILAVFSTAVSCISSAAFAEGCHVSTRLAKKHQSNFANCNFPAFAGGNSWSDN